MANREATVAHAGQVLATLAGSVVSIRLSNPGKRNVLSAPMWTQLRQEFTALSGKTDVRCVVLAGEGTEAFSAGADVSEFEQLRCTPDQVEHYHEQLVVGALDSIAACDIPVVAAIRGTCMGGGLEIASVCDIRLCSASSRFGAAVGLLGFPMAPRELSYLMRFAGRATTAELLLEGRIFNADEALDQALVSRVVPEDEFDAALKMIVQRICRGSPLAARMNKQQMRSLYDQGHDSSLEERRTFYQFANSDDYRAGRQAFLDKRTPIFTGT